MAITTINWDNKSDINVTATPRANKVVADDMNEIKSVVNTNANQQGDLANLNTSTKSSLVAAANELEGHLPVELYTQADNSRYSTYTLTDSVTNYNYIEIIGSFYTGATLSVKIPTSQTIFCISGYDFNASTEITNNIFYHIQTMNISDDTITFRKAGFGRGTEFGVGDSPIFIIYKILGYK